MDGRIISAKTENTSNMKKHLIKHKKKTLGWTAAPCSQGQWSLQHQVLYEVFYWYQYHFKGTGIVYFLTTQSHIGVYVG